MSILHIARRITSLKQRFGRTVIAASCMTLFALQTSIAAPVNYTIETNHTYASFAAQHLHISWWRGKLNSTGGNVMLDTDTQTGYVKVILDTASINFSHQKMNEVARGKEFFDVERYPTATYQGNLVDFKNGVPTRAVGELTLLGVTRPLELTIESFRCIMHPLLRKEVCGAEVTGQFNRSEFGMNYLTGISGDAVKLNIQVEALKD